MKLRSSAVPLIEQAYAGLSTPRDAWLASLKLESEKLFDGVLGSAQAFQFEVDANGQQRTIALAADEPYATAFRTIHALAPRTLVSKLYLRGPVSTVSAVLSLASSSKLKSIMTSTGVPDVVGAIGLDPGGGGVALSWLRREPGPMKRDVRQTLLRIAAHVASAARLRERSTSRVDGDAVISADGRVVHAERDARDADQRTALREAALRMDRARMRRRSEDLVDPAAMWMALVEGRWTLVERFDSDGRRVLIARRNDPTTRADLALTEREKKVVALVAAGHPLKLAAYELGLGTSTVCEALQRAMTKMGVTSRAALVEMHGAVIAKRLASIPSD
jgi:DNA-binding CsgD family transcriptional regulator